MVIETATLLLAGAFVGGVLGLILGVVCGWLGATRFYGEAKIEGMRAAGRNYRGAGNEMRENLEDDMAQAIQKLIDGQAGGGAPDWKGILKEHPRIGLWAVRKGIRGLKL